MANRRPPDPATDDSTARRPVRAQRIPTLTPPRAQLTPEARRALIAEAAYLRAERRGFAPGHETEDWLEAEAEVDTLLRVERSPRQ